MIFWKVQKKNFLDEDWISDICYKVCEISRMKVGLENHVFVTLKGYDL